MIKRKANLFFPPLIFRTQATIVIRVNNQYSRWYKPQYSVTNQNDRPHTFVRNASKRSLISHRYIFLHYTKENFILLYIYFIMLEISGVCF